MTTEPQVDAVKQPQIDVHVSIESLDPARDAVSEVAAHKDEWVRVGIPDRIRLLRRCMAGVAAVAPQWAARAAQVRHIDPRSPAAGEEWVSGVMATMRGLRLLIEALEAGGHPRPPALSTRPDGQRVAHVFPRTLIDRLTYSGMTAEVWIEPGQAASQGRIYREKQAGVFPRGRVALVLGAGNISSIGPLDVLTKLVEEDQVAILKLNPVNEYLAPFFERAFAPLIEPGYLRVITGGKAVGEYLCQHPQIDTIHLTGSDRTYDAIVWGDTPGEQAERKQAARPRVDKEVTAELGCVTPVLVVPGRWSAAELEFQARHVASMVTHNGSFNCTAAKVLLIARGWPQRGAFLAALADAMTKMPPRYAYYPGAEARYAEFVRHYPQAQALGADGRGVVPWTFIPDVTPAGEDYALRNEAFCGVLAEVSLDASDPVDYLRKAVRFANDRVWGSLSCVVLVHPRTARRHHAAVEQALADLRYGNIGVNVWTGANFTLGVTAWGPYPGNRSEEIGSGRGWVHNTYLFDYPQKSIVRGPFRPRPKPIWFGDHRTLLEVGRRLVPFEAAPSWLKLPGLFVAAIRG